MMETQYFSFRELCNVTALPSKTIIEIVDQGIIDPQGSDPQTWLFNTQMVSVTKKACRLHDDLEIDWSGIALAISLLEELEQIRHENQQLRAQLNRFITG
jgi:chaperone modulatory protein CbpM